MKLILAMILALICAACGDTVNNTYSTPGTTTTTGGTGGVAIFTNATTHPAAIVGAAAYIPSNTFCTPKMNEILSIEGTPDTINVSDSVGTHNRMWNYVTPTLRTTYYFTWNDIGYLQYATPVACGFNFYKDYTITP